MPNSISIAIEFCEPFWCADFEETEALENGTGEVRRKDYARWFRRDEAHQRPYIAGTVVWQAVVNAAEELLRLKEDSWNGEKCCLNEGPSPLRQMPQSANPSSPCTCPFCLLRTKESVLFRNASPPRRIWYRGIEDIAIHRTLNRVDFMTGKAQDYFTAWEVDHNKCGEFIGTVVFKDESVKDLLTSAIQFVDTLCGALCQITVLSGKEAAERKNKAPYTHDYRLGDESRPRPSDTAVSAIRDWADALVTKLNADKKLDKARLLAATVRDLRRERPDIVGKLPKGKRTKEGVDPEQEQHRENHPLWDLKVADSDFRTKLGDWKSFGISEWRSFCETFAEALKKAYREKSGEENILPLPTRDKQNYSHSGSVEPFTNKPLRRGMTSKEWIVRGEVQAVTPFFFGTGVNREGLTDFQVLLDKEGHYRIPHSAIRGAFRRDLRIAFGGSGCDAELGGKRCHCKVCTILRRVKILSTASEEKAPPEVRQRIKINHYPGVATEGGLFDMEVGSKGTAFGFVMRYRGGDKLPDELVSVLRYWEDERMWLGGSGGTGKGRFKLDINGVFAWDLGGQQGLEAFISAKGMRGQEEAITVADSNEWLKKCILPERQTLAPYTDYLSPLWTEVGYTISFASPVISGDPIAALISEEGYDTIACRRQEKDGTGWEYYLKGETIRGVVRTAVGKRNNVLGDKHEECPCILCTMFGNEHEAGRLRFEDAIAQTVTPKAIDNVAIDRFLGGGRQHAKYDKLVASWGQGKTLQFKGKLWIKNDLAARDPHKHQRIYSQTYQAFCDIGAGLYAVGGCTGTGYGEVEKITLDSLTLPPLTKDDQAGTGAIAEDQRYHAYREIPMPEIHEKGEAIYYPYYFVTPHTFVPRDCQTELTGHEKFDAKKFSGRITCTLKTQTPLIIPDSEGVEEDATTCHKTYRFFTLGETPYIPGSEIRGPISAVYEALTNSCFRVFDETHYISWRMDPAGDVKPFRPGRIKMGEDKKLYAEEMKECRLPLFDVESVTSKLTFDKFCEPTADETRNKKICTAIEVNKAIAKAAEQNRTYLRETHRGELREVLAGRTEVRFLEPYRADRKNPKSLITTLNDAGPYRGWIKFNGTNKVEIANTTEPDDKDFDKLDPCELNILLRSLARDTEMGLHLVESTVKKYPRPFFTTVKAGKQYTLWERCARVFYRPEGGGIVPPHPLLQRAIDQYNDLVVWSRKDPERRGIDQRFTTIHHNSVLSEGDNIYFRLNGEGEVDAIVPVRISRLYAHKPTGKKLHNDLRPCQRFFIEEIADDSYIPDPLFLLHPDGLCPACRLFGTTHYRGRVRFGFARLKGKPRWLTANSKNKGNERITLPLLEEARYTWGVPSDQFDIPGRKFFVHHNGWEDVVRDQPTLKKKADKNYRTVEALDKDNEFEFQIIFENLENWELGLLLYSLELQDNMANKIGMGKPLGFGSVKIKVDRIETMNIPADKDKPVVWTPGNALYGPFIGEGLTQLKRWFGKEYDQIDHVKNLLNLLTFPDKNVRVGYPLLNKDMDDEHLGYTYEMLKDKSGVSHQQRVTALKKPWTPFLPIEEIITATPPEPDNSAQGTSKEPKMAGSIKWYNPNKEFGFIISEEKGDIFFHKTSLKKGFTPTQYQKVQFGVKRTAKGLAATDVEPFDEA